MSHNVDYQSLVYDWKPATTIPFADFVPHEGPNGGRVVIDAFKIRLFGTITVGTGTFDGRDLWRLLAQLITIEKADGRNRWNLSGVKSRAMSIRMNGIDKHIEHATLAVAAGDTVDLTAVIPMRQRFRAKPEEYSLAAEQFKQLVLVTPSLAGAATGTAVLSADDLSVQVLVEWHEEMYLEHKVDWVVKSTDFNNNTQAQLALTGLMQDALLIIDDGTAGGGNSIAAITDVRCEDLGTPVAKRADLVNSYTMKFNLAPSGASAVAAERFHEPVRDGKLLPFMVADHQTAPWDGKLIPKAKIDVGVGAAGLSVITTEIVNKSEADYNAIASKHGVSAQQWGMADKNGNIVPLASDKFSTRQKRMGAWRAPLKKAA